MVLEVRSIQENYQVNKALGKGTFGDVYSAQSRANPNKIVAIKTLRGTAQGIKATVNYDFSETLREVIFFRQVPLHANIIELYDMFQDTESQNVVFALECMRGNMFQFIEYHRKKSEKTGLDTLVISKITKDILKGLEHIHNHGFVHRDIKPENVLWTGKGTNIVIKLADFGLSRSMAASDRQWTGYVATRWYRSPEQLLNTKLHSSAVDIWAVSLVLYEICNFAPLFPGKTTSDMIERQIEALGLPTRNAVGGHSTVIFNSLEQLFGAGIRKEINDLKGFIMTPEWFRWETHECFADTLVSGLQWNPERRPTALQMLNLIRKDTRAYQQEWASRVRSQLKRTRSI